MNRIISAIIAITCLCGVISSCNKAPETAKESAVSGVSQNLPVYNIAQSDTSTPR